MTGQRVLPVAVALLVFHLGAAAAAANSAADTVGSVKGSSGAAAILRGGRSLPASPGLRLEAGDVIETGPDGRVGVILRDDGVLSLGPSSRVAIESFLFVPAERKLGFVVRIARGTLAYISGVIGRLAPETVRFRTPVATAGIRGTHLAIRVAP